MLILTIDDNLREFAPGQVIEGIAGWQDEAAPKDAVLRLFWYTEGRGTQDVNVVAEKEFAMFPSAYEERFQLILPDQPYSYSGAITSIQWALELVLNKGKDVVRVDILVSPWTEKLTLASLEMK
ncbi:MAG TPA: hypothetical protein PLI09_16715 [Candidatus Hydrogenedentes bacterium]|nr:hypothetical protein [Candidatus Hydrogenedentota bacterium]